MTRPAVSAICLTLALALASCGSAEVAPAPTPAATPTPVATPVAATTPAPSATPEPAATQSPPPTPTPADTPTPAPTPERELDGLTNWLNSEPLTIAELVARNRVVLVDFWTYTCVNCVRTLPRLRQWHERYAAHGLTIIGVHAPEFDFEREPDNVAEAVARLGIAYPVAQDNDYVTWQAFYNCCWPAKYLIGSDGALVYRHVGEGAYQSTERAIREALEAAGHDLSGVPPGADPDPDFDPVATAQTRELYGGYARNYARVRRLRGPGCVLRGIRRGPRLRRHGRAAGRHVVPAGRVAQRARGDRARPHHRGSVGLLRRSRSSRGRCTSCCGLSAQSRSRRSSSSTGARCARDEAGADVTFDEEGRSVVHVEEPRMYRVVDLPQWGEHELRVRSDSDNLAIFAVTFGSYAEEP